MKLVRHTYSVNLKELHGVDHKMSPLTEEQSLWTGHSVKKIIKIRNFDKVLKTFQTGREIYSHSFEIRNSTFHVGIFPGGDFLENSNFVSLFVPNNNDWSVKLKMECCVQQMFERRDCEEESDGLVRSRAGMGLPRWIHRSRCIRGDLLDCRGTLTFQVVITLLEEDGYPFEKIEDLEKTVVSQGKEIKKLRTETMELRDMMRKLWMTVKEVKKGGSSTEDDSEVECPVCMEVVRPPMRLQQCGKGHIICDSCQDRTRETIVEEVLLGNWEVNPNLDMCHACREPLTGRPSQLEKILQLV